LLDFVKKAISWVKGTAAKHAAKLGMSVLVIIMLFLGLNIDWSCGKGKGWECQGKYVPPDPEDVNKILKQGNNR